MGKGGNSGPLSNFGICKKKLLAEKIFFNKKLKLKYLRNKRFIIYITKK